MNESSTTSSDSVEPFRTASPKKQNVFLRPHSVLGRKGLERLDLLLLAIESIDLNGGESLIWVAQQLGLENVFPNRVELWKQRCHNPLRRSTRRGSLDSTESEGLILLLCSMSQRLYPLIHQLLSSKEPIELSRERWKLLNKRLIHLMEERMNTRLSSVQRLMTPTKVKELSRQLVFTLALSAGPGGVDRLRASLLDPTP